MVGRDEGRTGQVRRVVAVALGGVQAGTVRSGLVGWGWLWRLGSVLFRLGSLSCVWVRHGQLRLGGSGLVT